MDFYPKSIDSYTFNALFIGVLFRVKINYLNYIPMKRKTIFLLCVLVCALGGNVYGQNPYSIVAIQDSKTISAGASNTEANWLNVAESFMFVATVTNATYNAVAPSLGMYVGGWLPTSINTAPAGRNAFVLVEAGDIDVVYDESTVKYKLKINSPTDFATMMGKDLAWVSSNFVSQTQKEFKIIYINTSNAVQEYTQNFRAWYAPDGFPERPFPNYNQSYTYNHILTQYGNTAGITLNPIYINDSFALTVTTNDPFFTDRSLGNFPVLAPTIFGKNASDAQQYYIIANMTREDFRFGYVGSDAEAGTATFSLLVPAVSSWYSTWAYNSTLFKVEIALGWWSDTGSQTTYVRDQRINLIPENPGAPVVHPEALPTPINLSLDGDNKLTFDAVNNATSYTAKVFSAANIIVHSIENFTSGSIITGFDTPGSYSVKIQAIGNGGRYLNSVDSDGISWVITGTVAPPTVISVGTATASFASAVVSVTTQDGDNSVAQIRFFDAVKNLDVKLDVNQNNEYTILNLSEATSYSFTVTALDTYGNESDSYETTLDFMTLHTPSFSVSATSLTFTPESGVHTFTIEGEYLLAPLVINSPVGLTITPTVINPENGIINKEITVIWDDGFTQDGIITVTGGGLYNHSKQIAVIATGFSEYCNTIISQENNELLYHAYMTVEVSKDKKVMTFTIAPYSGRSVQWDGVGTSIPADKITIGGVAPSTLPIRNRSVDRTKITITFSEALKNGDEVAFGNPLVWTTFDDTGNTVHNNCYINAAKKYTVGFGCNLAGVEPKNTWLNMVGAWRSAENWSKGEPMGGDDLLIPSATNYPVLDSNVTVKSITFEPGAELGGLNYLAHESAVVKYGLNNRWYLLSNPFINNVKVRDFYLGGNPAISARKVTIDELGEIQWQNFTSTTEEFPSGEGFAFIVKADNQKITVPYAEAAYTYQLRTQSFNKDVSFGYGGSGYNEESKFALLGNPFMTTIDFTKFAADNPDLTKNYMLRGASGYIGYTEVGPWGSIKSTDIEKWSVDAEYKYIAPLQSFIVEINDEDYDYTANKDAVDIDIEYNLENIGATNENANVALRSAVNPANKLNIIASNNNGSVLTFIAERENSQDASKLFNGIDATPDIYTLKAANGQTAALGANFIGTNEAVIPLALATTSSDDITFTFSGMNNYDANILFVDVQGESIDLTGKPTETYTFSYAGSSTATEDRFLLEFTPRNALNIKETSGGGLSVYGKENAIHAVSSSGNPIQQIFVYNTHGQLIFANDDINAPTYVSPYLNASEIYIVKVITANGAENVKVRMQ